MICVFFVSAILAKKYSVIATIALRINIGVVFAENLKIVLNLTDLAFNHIVDFDWHRLICIN